MSKRIASKAKAKRVLRKGHNSMYKPSTSSKDKGNVKKGAWSINPHKKTEKKPYEAMYHYSGDGGACLRTHGGYLSGPVTAIRSKVNCPKCREYMAKQEKWMLGK